MWQATLWNLVRNMRRVEKMPCFNCEKRHVGCHSSCEEYAEFKRNFSEQKEIERKQEERQNIVVNYIFESRERQRRRNGKKWQSKNIGQAWKGTIYAEIASRQTHIHWREELIAPNVPRKTRRKRESLEKTKNTVKNQFKQQGNGGSETRQRIGARGAENLYRLDGKTNAAASAWHTQGKRRKSAGKKRVLWHGTCAAAMVYVLSAESLQSERAKCARSAIKSELMAWFRIWKRHMKNRK